jgi:hypothetical protein
MGVGAVVIVGVVSVEILGDEWMQNQTDWLEM